MQDNGRCRKSQCHEIIACRTRTTTPDAAQPGLVLAVLVLLAAAVVAPPRDPWVLGWVLLLLLVPLLRVVVVVLVRRASLAPRRLQGSYVWVLLGCMSVCECVCSRCCIKHFKLSVKIKRCIAKLTNVASKRAQNALAAHLRVERMLCSALVYKVVNRMCNAHTHTERERDTHTCMHSGSA